MGKKRNEDAAVKKVAMVGNTGKAASRVTQNPRKSKKKTIIAASVSAIVIVAIVISVVLLIPRSNEFDYMSADLGEYIELPSEVYKNYTLELSFDKVGEDDVERKIMSLLYQNKSADAANKGAEVFRVPISVGDTVYIYYRGYTVDENGWQTDIDGASNMLSSYDSLGIGSLSFIPGFEEGLIGAVPWDHQFDPEFHRMSSGEVSADDVVYLSYSVMRPDGTTEKKTAERIDLSCDNIDERYGEGFEEFLENSTLTVGKKITESKTFELGQGTAVYFDMTVNNVIRCENEPLTIEARFPADYSEKSLRGKNVFFDVYFKSSVVYDVPEYNEDFITETLKLTAEDLEDYDGTTLVEKHRAYLMSVAVEENEAKKDALIEEAIWDYYKAQVEIKKLPKDELESIYDALYSELYAEYQTYYSSYFSSLDEYARAKYSLAANADVTKFLAEEAKSIVTEKIIFYYIIREEDLIPSASEFDLKYETFVAEHLSYYTEEIYDDELAAIENEEEKTRRIAEIKKEMMDYYGEGYFTELVYYDHAYETVIGYAEIIEK